MQTYNKNDFRWLHLCRACFQELAHFPCPRRLGRRCCFLCPNTLPRCLTWLGVALISVTSDPRLVELRGNVAVLAKLAAWVLFRARQSSIASWPWPESEGVIPVGASPNGWRTVEVCEIKKTSLFLTQKKMLWGALNQKKTGSLTQ